MDVLPPSLPSSPSAILLVRMSARGDLVFATPLIRAFRRSYPDTRLVWLAEPRTADLVAHHPELDGVLTLPRKRWAELLRGGHLARAWREIRLFRSELRAWDFDVAIDLQGLAKSGFAAWLSGAPIRIGFGPREGSGVLMTHVVPRDLWDPRTMSSEYRGLADLLGLETDDFALDVVLGDDDAAFARDAIEGHGLGNGYVAIVPFTTKPQKHWVEDRWSAVIEGVKRELGLPTVILGGPDDRAAADRILADAPDTTVDLVDRTTLGQAAAVVRDARLLIGVDTALTHLATALQVPTLALFGATTPYLDPGVDSTRILYHRLPCSPCVAHPTCNGAFTCMKRIGVDEALRTARELVGAGAPDR